MKFWVSKDLNKNNLIIPAALWPLVRLCLQYQQCSWGKRGWCGGLPWGLISPPTVSRIVGRCGNLDFSQRWGSLLSVAGTALLLHLWSSEQNKFCFVRSETSRHERRHLLLVPGGGNIVTAQPFMFWRTKSFSFNYWKLISWVFLQKDGSTPL
jgi:hypothetical protein